MYKAYHRNQNTFLFIFFFIQIVFIAQLILLFFLLSSYPSDFWSPRHHNCVGDGGGQSDKRGYIDGATRPFWFNSILGWREISLQTWVRNQRLCFLVNVVMQRQYERTDEQREISKLTGRLQGLLLTFTHRLGGKWSSWGQLVSDKQNLKMKKRNSRSDHVAFFKLPLFTKRSAWDHFLKDHPYSEYLSSEVIFKVRYLFVKFYTGNEHTRLTV